MDQCSLEFEVMPQRARWTNAAMNCSIMANQTIAAKDRAPDNEMDHCSLELGQKLTNAAKNREHDGERVPLQIRLKNMGAKQTFAAQNKELRSKWTGAAWNKDREGKMSHCKFEQGPCRCNGSLQLWIRSTRCQNGPDAFQNKEHASNRLNQGHEI